MNVSDRVNELLHERAKVAMLLAALERIVAAPRPSYVMADAIKQAEMAIRHAKGESA